MANASAADPSMEEILASIRKIISDETGEDDGAGAAVDAEADGAGEGADMSADEELSQDDLDALFESLGDDDGDDASEIDLGGGEEETSDAEIEALMQSMDSDDEDGDEDVFDLTEDLEIVESIEDEIELVDPVSDDDMAGFGEEVAAEPEPAVAAFTPTIDYTPVDESVAAQQVDLEKPLISQATDSVVSSAFDHLSHMIVATKARTMEDLMQDMLRPMLKAWLDTNLPPLVEELVKKEIERVTRRRL